MRPGFVRARYVSVSMYKQIAHLMDLAAFILRHRVGIFTSLAVLAIDQVAKLLVIWTLAIGDSRAVDGPFRLTHVVNTGNTLDLFSGHTTVLIAISVTGIGLLFALYWYRTRTGARAQVTFGVRRKAPVGVHVRFVVRPIRQLSRLIDRYRRRSPSVLNSRLVCAVYPCPLLFGGVPGNRRVGGDGTGGQ